MNIQNLIHLIDSNMFLVVSYALIFILISSYALRFLAKVFIFFMYIGMFGFGIFYMFSSSPDLNTNDISINKIAKNISDNLQGIQKAYKNSKNLIADIQKTFDINKAKQALADSNANLKKIRDYTSNQLGQGQAATQNGTANSNVGISNSETNKKLDDLSKMFNDISKEDQ